MKSARAREFESLLRRLQERPIASDELAQLIVDSVARVMGTEVATLYVHDAAADELILAATRGLGRAAVGYVTLRPGEGMSGRAARDLVPVMAADVRDDATFQVIPAFDEDRYSSLLAVPMAHEAALVGVLNVQTIEVHQYRDRDVHDLAAIAELIAPCIHTLWAGDLPVRLRGSSVLSHIDGMLSRPVDPTEAAEQLVRQLRLVLPRRSVRVLLRSADGAVTAHGGQPDAANLNDIERVSSTSGAAREWRLTAADAHVPLHAGARCVGEIVLGPEESPAPLSGVAVRLLESVASRVGSAFGCHTSVARTAATEASDAGILDLSDELIKLVLDETSLEALLDYASARCACDFAITDKMGVVVAGRLPELVAESLALASGNVSLGRLLASESPYGAAAFPAVARAVALQLSKWKARFDVECELRGNALESLLTSDRREQAMRTQSLGIDVARSYIPVAIHFDVAEVSERQGNIALRSIVNSIQRTFGAPPTSVNFVRPEGVLVLVDEATLPRGAAVPACAVLEALRETLPGSTVAVGIGPTMAKPADYPAGVREAQLAATLGARLRTSAPLHAAQFGTFRLLLALEHDNRLQQFVDDYLGALIDHDTRFGSEFIRTLEAFHAAGERLRPAATALFVHVNTLRYRLQRISELTGRDLDAVADRFNMYLALYALRLTQPERQSLLPNEYRSAPSISA
jgi:putative methionine-R-sulfoxide reductase with GAF domain